MERIEPLVQLKSDIEDLERCKLNPAVQMPPWQSSESVREQLDGTLRTKMLDWGCYPGRKALVVGATWPRLVNDLADRDMFVTLVDDDAERVKQVSEAVGAAGFGSDLGGGGAGGHAQ